MNIFDSLTEHTLSHLGTGPWWVWKQEKLYKMDIIKKIY